MTGTTAMRFTVGERRVRPLTAAEMLRMVELGVMDAHEPVELLHGMLVRRGPKTPAHETAKTRLMRWLAPGIRDERFDVRVGSPFAVPDPTSLPEPDVAVVERVEEPPAFPTAALLVVEIADGTVRTDLEVKPPLYAAAGVPEVWVVDVGRRCVHVLDGPAAEGGYARHRVIEDMAERLVPGHVDGVEPLTLGGLLAGL